MSKTVAILCILLILALSLASYEWYQSQFLESENTQLLSKNTQLLSAYNDLNQRYTSVNSSLAQSQEMYNELLSNYSRKNIIHQNPSTNESINIWGMQQTVPPNGSIYWELLDTFDNHIQMSTNATARFFIMSLDNFVNFATAKPFTAIYNSTGTHFDEDVPISEGCGAYVLVILNLGSSPILLYPDVTATYAWTPFLTGVCSLP